MSKNRLEVAPKLNLTGCLLVAAPQWSDSEFQQSVCLIVHHSSRGAVGVVLNRSLPFDGQILWSQIGQANDPMPSDKFYLGGPNSGPVVAMHQREDLAEFTSGEGVYFAAQVDYLKSLLKDHSGNLKIYLGQAAWDAGALDQQFETGCWLPLEISRQVAFADGDRMWSVAIRQIGNRFIENLVGAQRIPTDVSVN